MIILQILFTFFVGIVLTIVAVVKGGVTDPGSDYNSDFVPPIMSEACEQWEDVGEPILLEAPAGSYQHYPPINPCVWAE